MIKPTVNGAARIVTIIPRILPACGVPRRIPEYLDYSRTENGLGVYPRFIQKKDCADRNLLPQPTQGTPSRCAHCRKAISRKVPAPRTFEKILEKPPRVGPRGPRFFIFHKHGGILHSWISFAITALIVPKSRTTEKRGNIIVSRVLRIDPGGGSERPQRIFC